MILTATQQFLKDLATVAKIHSAGVGPLDLAEVHLAKTIGPFDKFTPLATLTSAEANYAGYAAGVITWSVVTTADDGSVELIGTVPEFRPSDGVTPNGIFSLWIEDAGHTKVYFVGNLDTYPAPSPMNGTTDAITITVRYRPSDDSVAVEIS